MKKVFILITALLTLIFFTAGCSKVPVPGNTPAPSADGSSEGVVEITVPDYVVTPSLDAEGVSELEIPDGQLLMVEEGRPLVPYYAKSIDYPKGQMVQAVTLSDKSGAETQTGLKLPVVSLDSNESTTPEMIQEKYPAVDFTWKLWTNPDGGSTLIIAVFPLQYDPATTEITFCKNYKFKVEYIQTTVSITGIKTADESYSPGDDVVIDISLENSGSLADVTVKTVIKDYKSGETIEELPSRVLKELSGKASYSPVWVSGQAEAGAYSAEISLYDKSNNLLDIKQFEFSLTPPT